MNPAPWLSDDEIDDLCSGLRRNDAKARHLRSLGIVVNLKPNGRPLVMRSHAEAVLSGMTEIASAPMAVNPPQINTAGIIAMFGKRAA